MMEPKSRNPDFARTLLAKSDLICDADTVNRAISQIGKDMSIQFQDSCPIVFAVMGGAIVFAGKLLPELRFPLDFDYLHATRYGAATSGGTIDWLVAPRSDVRGRQVIVLDDILDGGHTMRAIRDRLVSLGAARVYSAVLVEKMISEPKPIRADFVGLRVPDRFVFGCGMDAMGYWRNLPDIRAVPIDFG